MGIPLSLRDKLHQYIDVADEQKLQAIYTLLKMRLTGAIPKKTLSNFINAGKTT